MSKIFKYVPVFFFWLAGLTLSAHILIPHDHHLADPYSLQDRNCPVQDINSDHKSRFPVHCHAFNDLATEKLRLYHISQNFQFNFILLGVLTESNKPVLPRSCVTIIDFQKPVFVTYTLVSTLLRAPPTVA